MKRIDTQTKKYPEPEMTLIGDRIAAHPIDCGKSNGFFDGFEKEFILNVDKVLGNDLD